VVETRADLQRRCPGSAGVKLVSGLASAITSNRHKLDVNHHTFKPLSLDFRNHSCWHL